MSESLHKNRLAHGNYAIILFSLLYRIHPVISAKSQPMGMLIQIPAGPIAFEKKYARSTLSPRLIMVSNSEMVGILRPLNIA